MKKVLGVAVAASLVAGMAFADVAISMNARERVNAYHSITTKEEDGAGNKTYTYLFDLNGEKASAGADKMQDDTVAFSAKTDYAGIVYKLRSTYTALDSNKNYYGWMSFKGLKFTFGYFGSTFANKYGVTAGQAGLLDNYDYTKYGLNLLNSGYTSFMKEANNLTTIEGTRSNTLLADYTFADVAGGKLMVKGGLIQNNTAAKYYGKDATEKSKQFAGYIAEADYQADSVALSTIVKKLTKDQTIFGVYVEPKLPVKTAFGFTYGTDKDTSGTKVNAYAIDARAQYKVSDAMLATAFAKFENAKADVSGAKADTALSAGTEVSYIVNDKVTGFFDFVYANADLDKEDTALVNSKDSMIRVRPGVVLTAGKGATVTAALQYDSYTGKSDAYANTDTKSELSIPVIFKVAL